MIGKYTGKYNRIFGRGRMAGVDSWILIGHKSNCRAESIIWNNQPMNSLEVRICVQNVIHPVIIFELHKLCKVSIYNESKSSTIIPVSSPTILAINGIQTQQPQTDSIPLKQYDFIVFSIQVICEPEVEYETDFLIRAKCITMYYHLLQHSICSSANNALPLIALDSYFVDEFEVWDSYIELPRGIVLLRETAETY